MLYALLPEGRILGSSFVKSRAAFAVEAAQLKKSN
jgi:hypothetical protein